MNPRFDTSLLDFARSAETDLVCIRICVPVAGQIAKLFPPSNHLMPQLLGRLISLRLREFDPSAKVLFAGEMNDAYGVIATEEKANALEILTEEINNARIAWRAIFQRDADGVFTSPDSTLAFTFDEFVLSFQRALERTGQITEEALRYLVAENRKS